MPAANINSAQARTTTGRTSLALTLPPVEYRPSLKWQRILKQNPQRVVDIFDVSYGSLEANGSVSDKRRTNKWRDGVNVSNWQGYPSSIIINRALLHTAGHRDCNDFNPLHRVEEGLLC